MRISLRRVVVRTAIAALVYIAFLLINYLSDDVEYDMDAEVMETEDTGEDQMCILPKLELWHPALKDHFKDPEPLKCAEEENWVYVSEGKFFISPKAQQDHGHVTCYYTPILRDSDFTVYNGTTEIAKKNGSSLKSDFFQVKCTATDGANYSNIHSGIAFRKDLPKPLDGNVPPRGMNILMFGFDSMSRMTWMRNLPKTHEYLVKGLKGVVLEGYNIVGDGTPQALLPILTGKTEAELPEARRSMPNAKTVDDFPWIWADLKKRGYVTQWGEDGAYVGTFACRMMGFRNPPTDHYMRPFYLVAEKAYKDHHPYCLGSQPRHVNMLNWVRDFFDMYPNKPKFSFLFHSEFTHGGYSEVRVADEDVKNFLRDMNMKGHLKNTLLILMADHGPRYQSFRRIVQGKYEERMPYFSLRFPEWFQKKRPKAMKNLKSNAHKLTTPFDIHETLTDVIQFSGAGKGNISHRGISLFKQIPEKRNCAHAGIEPHWCSCLDWKVVRLDSPNVRTAALYLVDNINTITAFKRGACAELQLQNITDAERYSPKKSLIKFKQTSDRDGRNPDLSDRMKMSDVYYQIMIITSPGYGMFEATLKYSLVKGKPEFRINHKDISRVNKYGDAPQCVAKQYPHLRPYCYCI